jgi:hypothetical protein
MPMKCPTKAATVGMEVVGVLALQAVAVFVVYGRRSGEAGEARQRK